MLKSLCLFALFSAGQSAKWLQLRGRDFAGELRAHSHTHSETHTHTRTQWEKNNCTDYQLFSLRPQRPSCDSWESDFSRKGQRGEREEKQKNKRHRVERVRRLTQVSDHTRWLFMQGDSVQLSSFTLHISSPALCFTHSVSKISSTGVYVFSGHLPRPPCSFGAKSKQKCFLTNLSSQKIGVYRDNDLLWMLYVRLHRSSPSVSPLSPSPSLPSPLSWCSPDCLLHHFISLSLPCVIHFSFSFFPDQYAGQQAVRQIVCCELHQTPRSIVSELCWIHSDVFKPRQVERSQGSACEVRWGDRGEGRVRRGGVGSLSCH